MRRMRGVALIIALVVVALATILATRIGAQGALDQRRGATLLAQEQAFEVALGAETWAIEILREDAANSKRDSLDEAWATPVPPIPIEGGSVQGQLEDLQGRFNLNNLVKPDGSKNQLAFDQFLRLLQALQLEPKWASLALDWIDPDTVVDGVDGAEDGVYLGQSPPYRAANHPITSTSELLALPGFGIERYRKLAPFVAALPVGTPLNVCTASGVVLDSLAAGLAAFGQDAKQLAANRQKGCFPFRRRGGARPARPGSGSATGHRPRADRVDGVVPRDDVGQYWHYRTHAVQSDRAQSRGLFPRRPAHPRHRVIHG
jgi:general secretion pathway protein K